MKSEAGLIFALALAAACGGARPATDAEGSASPVTMTLSDDGRLLVNGELPDDAVYARAVPRLWPATLGEPPTLAAGELVPSGDALDFVPWAVVSSVPVEELELRPERRAPATLTAKHACQVQERSATEVSIACGHLHGVSEGDLYLVYGGERAEEDSRPGVRTSALLRVLSVDEKESRARIEHARIAPTTGTVAVYAQASFDLPAQPAAILVAPFDDDTETGAFPVIADALPEYLAEFGITNIGVEAFPTFLDPEPHDAAAIASEAAEASGVAYGAIVFGRVTDNVLVFNATAFGSAPHPATTVGILPGGLPLTFDENVGALSRQLAPSFLATVLALRGDHAIAVYLLESILATETLDSAVRYHLREHLALRYSSLGRPIEALRIMAEDIERSERTGDRFARLNALSIRSFLAQEAGLLELWQSDVASFLDAARDVLPERALVRERLDLARASIALDEVADGRALIEAELESARELGDLDAEYAALVEREFAMVDDPVAARLAFTELEPLLPELDSAQRALVNLVSAELAAADGEVQVADAAVRAALTEVSEEPPGPLRASVYRRAAGVFSSIGRADAAAVALHEAARMFLDTAQLQRASITLVELTFAQLEWAHSAPPGEAAAQVQEARNNLLLGAELAGRLGYYSDAAHAFLWAGLFEHQLGRPDVGNQLLERAEQFALPSGDYNALHEVYSSRARISAEAGDLEAAEGFQTRALLFAEAGGIEPVELELEAGEE